MSPLSLLRRFPVSELIGLGGLALCIRGLFLPWIITISSSPPSPVVQSLWPDFPSFGFLILFPVLGGIGFFLVKLCGKGKRSDYALHLVYTALGLLVFLLLSVLPFGLTLCYLRCVSYVRVLGSGFWLILGGFLLSMGASLSRILLLPRTRAEDHAEE